MICTQAPSEYASVRDTNQYDDLATTSVTTSPAPLYQQRRALDNAPIAHYSSLTSVQHIAPSHYLDTGRAAVPNSIVGDQYHN
jgi:hypothetical protein